jgi:hypothetical protein
MSTSPKSLPRKDYIAEKLMQFSELFNKKGAIPFDLYDKGLADMTNDQLKLAMDAVPSRCRFFPTVYEIRELVGLGQSENGSKVETVAQERNRVWDTITLKCFTAEKGARGLTFDYRDPRELECPEWYGAPNEQGYIVIRTQGKEFIGYDAFRAALRDRTAFQPFHGVLFLTVNADRREFVPVRFDWDDGAERYIVRHACADHPKVFPNNEKPLF